jgi:beta-lactamase regulating signal transducer with metallopeptidase domain
VDDLLSFAGVWLVTYLMHSTLLLAGVGLIDRFRWVKFNTAIETLWKFAIIGGIVSATMQCTTRSVNVLSVREWSLGRLAVFVCEPNDLHSVTSIESERVLHNKSQNSTSVVDSPSKIAVLAPKYSTSQTDLTYAYAERFALGIVSILALIWLLGAIINTSRLVWLGRLAHSELKNRTKVDSWSSVDSAPGSVPVHSKKLSVSTEIDSPMALPNGEIIVPSWIFNSLTAEQRKAVYAHEIAHQLRRDPMWLIFLHFLVAFIWIQPLHRLARRRLVHLAELQADAWAARTLSDSRVLAESLFACAERVVANRKVLFGSTFSSKGALIERIDCLLDGSAMQKPRNSYLIQISAISFLVFATFLMPGCNVNSDVAYRSGEKISVTKQDDGKQGEASIRRANLLVKMTHTGIIKFTEAKDDVESLENEGQFQLAESRGDTKCIYTITADRLGNLKRTFSRNGKAIPIDEEAQAWFAEALERTLRETSF